MPISTKLLVDQINNKLLDASLSVTQVAALSAATCAINNNVVTVSTVSDLPAASISTGRMIYVESLCDYRYSDGASWVREYNSAAAYGAPFTVCAWGLNSSGQLGDNTTVNKSSPVSVVGGFLDWCQVSAGAAHTAAIRTNGSLWAWGCNSCGQLGDNTSIIKSSPVSVVGGFTDWCRISAGGYFNAAIRTNGTLWTWGSNYRGQIGDNTTVSKSSPVSVVGGFTDWCQVSAGSNTTAAIRTNGTLWTWGYNSHGLLGDNTVISKLSPVSVVGGFTDWCQVSAGSSITAAIRTNGTLWTWGYNGNGRLGDNTVVAKSSPVSVVGAFTDWWQVSAGNGHTAAIRSTVCRGF
jgi:alpha-tubulin suppressor-like RCC1 family protein